jgi:hypothetical protein
MQAQANIISHGHVCEHLIAVSNHILDTAVVRMVKQ